MINFIIANDVFVSSTELEFDLLFFVDDDSAVELSAVQVGVLVNPELHKDGLMTASIVEGSSEMAESQAPTTIMYSQIENVIKVPNRMFPGTGNGTIISGGPNSPLRFARIRLENSIPWKCKRADLAFDLSIIYYPTIISVYDGSVNTLMELTSDQAYSMATNDRACEKGSDNPMKYIVRKFYRQNN